MTTSVTFAELRGMEGADLGFSDWITVDQDRINTFADATDDLVERLDSIDQIVRDVNAIAINTRLLCLRQGAPTPSRSGSCPRETSCTTSCSSSG